MRRIERKGNAKHPKPRKLATLSPPLDTAAAHCETIEAAARSGNRGWEAVLTPGAVDWWLIKPSKRVRIGIATNNIFQVVGVYFKGLIR